MIAIRNRRLGLGSALLVALAATPALAEEGWPTVVIEAPPEIEAAVSARLSERGIQGLLAPGCPAIRVWIEPIGDGLAVTLKDPSGKVGKFQVMESETAASLIEAW